MENLLKWCFLLSLIVSNTALVTNVNEILLRVKHAQALQNSTSTFSAILPQKLFHLDEEEEHKRVLSGLQNLSVNPECEAMTDRFLRDSKLFFPYALKALDAWGKEPSGLFEFNDKWLGSYDQCLSVTKSTVNIENYFTAQYCTHYIEGITVYPVYWGSCVPATCNPEEVQDIFEYLMEKDQIEVKSFTTISCSQQSTDITTGMIVTFSVIGVLVVMSIYGTLFDVLVRYQLINFKGSKSSNCEKLCQFFIVFSWITNTEKLLDTTVRNKKTASLNGMRVLSMVWVVFGHTPLMMLGPANNVLGFVEKLKELSWQVITYGTVSVDTFFFISGFLVGLLTLKELFKRKGRLNWAMFYFHRYWRLTPLYMFLIMVYANLMPFMVHGPMAKNVLETPDRLSCLTDWWTNLLYINNFYANTMGEQCFGVGWYLQNDMQFYIISPIILFLLYKSAAAGIISGFLLILMNLVVLGVVANIWDLSPLFGVMPTGHAVIVKDHTYMRPYYRIAPYIVGMLLAYLLVKKDFKIKMPKVIVFLGWLLSTAGGIGVVYGLYHYGKAEGEPTMDAHLGYFFFAFHRFAFSVSLAWIVLACSTGYAGPVNSFLSWRGWLPLTRLSYSIYLVHIMLVMNIVNGNTKSVLGLTTFTVIIYFFGFFMMSVVMAYACSMLVEMPFIGLEKFIFAPLKKEHLHSKPLPAIPLKEEHEINNGIARYESVEMDGYGDKGRQNGEPGSNVANGVQHTAQRDLDSAYANPAYDLKDIEDELNEKF